MAGFLVATMALAFVVEVPEVRAETVEGVILCTNCGDPFAAEGTVIMTDTGGGTFDVSFDFTAEAGRLLDVYFEGSGWDGLSVESVIDSDSLVNGYIEGGTPADPPAGGNISVALGDAWTNTAISYTGDPSSSPPTITGSSGGYDEVLTISFSGLQGSFLDFATAVLLEFQNGFRIAMHIGNCTQYGESCTAIGAPIPAALWLFVSALLGWVGIGYRRQKAAPATAA